MSTAAVDSSVFGYSFNLEQCKEAEIVHLMSLVKKTLNNYRRNAAHSVDCSVDGSHHTPDQVYSLLDRIKSSCENTFNGNRLLCRFILDEVKKLLIFTGRICNERNKYILDEANQNVTSPAGILLQMICKIWIDSVHIFLTAESHELHPTDPLILQCDRCTGKIGKQVSYIILDDLLQMASLRFSRFASSSDLTIVNPFVNVSLEDTFNTLSCTLAKYHLDTWSILVDLVKNQTPPNTSTSDSVTVATGQCPQSIRYFHLNNSIQVTCNRELLLLWLMSYFSPIVSPESTLISNMVKVFIAREVPSVDSPSLKGTLIQSSNLLMKICSSSKCTPTVDVTFSLLELVMRRLNIPDDVHTVIPVNGHEWLLQLKKLSSHSSTQSKINESLFSSVLTLMSTIIDSLTRECTSNVTASQLSRLKGRLVSKIQDRKLQSLNELALYRFLSFFLLLATCRKDQWKEMCERICEISQKIVDTRDTASVWNVKVATNVKALFSLIHSMPSEMSTPPSKLKQLFCHSIPHLPSGTRHPLAAALLLSGKVSTAVVEILFHVIRYNYLSKFHSDSSCKTVLQFILQMHSTSKSNTLLHSKVQEEMRQLLDCLLERTLRLDESEMSLMQQLVKCIVTDTRQHSPSLLREVIFGTVEAFASSFLESAPNTMMCKIFRALEVFIVVCPELTSGTETVFGVLNRVIEGIEAKRMMGTEVLMRKFLNELLRKCSQ